MEFITSYVGAVIALCYGVWTIKRQLNYKGNDSVASIRGWAAGIGAVIFGIVVIILKLTGNWE